MLCVCTKRVCVRFTELVCKAVRLRLSHAREVPFPFPLFLFPDVNPVSLESKNNAKTFSSATQVPWSKLETNQSMGSWVLIEHTKKQTNRDYNFIYNIDALVIFTVRPRLSLQERGAAKNVSASMLNIEHFSAYSSPWTNSILSSI